MTRFVVASALAYGVLVPVHAEGLKPFGRGSWQAVLNAHASRPLVVHLWGLTCAPCLAELPNWGRLVQAHPPVDIVFVAADPVPEEATAIAATLSKAGLAGAESWMFADRFVDRLRFEIDPNWEGELPVTMLIGRDGKRIVKAGTLDLAIVRTWIEEQTRRH